MVGQSLSTKFGRDCNQRVKVPLERDLWYSRHMVTTVPSIPPVTVPPNSTVVVPGAVALIKGWLSPEDADHYGTKVVEETYPRWKSQLKYGKAGKSFDRGHAMARFGEPGVTYTYKGKSKPMHPMTPSLAALKQLVWVSLGWEPNCVVVNSYAPTSGIYPHCDSQYIPQLGPNPTIVAVSFGAERTFQLHPWDAKNEKYDRSKSVIDVKLGHGDLLIMHGACDSMYKHGIPEEPEVAGTRVSLTFRRHLS